jgi:hypothetical protein
MGARIDTSLIERSCRTDRTLRTLRPSDGRLTMADNDPQGGPAPHSRSVLIERRLGLFTVPRSSSLFRPTTESDETPSTADEVQPRIERDEDPARRD